MARITRQPSRKTVKANEIVCRWLQEVHSTVDKGHEAVLTQLEALLSAWPITEEKSDLFHWVELLNRFDELLETLLARCIPSEQLQAHPFTEIERRLVMAILEFSRLLLENCSSRNIFNSYDRLNVLLRCEDLSVVEKTLELLLIPARKIDSQKSLYDKFDNLIDYRVVEVLAGCMLSPLNPPGVNEKVDLRFSYYHYKRLEGLLQQQPCDLERENLEYCRLLALAIYLMMSSDVPADVTGFSINPTLIADTAKLISAVPTTPTMKIETGALAAMRGFLKFDSKWTETIYALDLTASHGCIANIFRTISQHIQEHGDVPYNHMFLMSFFDLTTSMATCAEFDEALVTSTVIDDIVKAIPILEPKFYKTVEKLMGVLEPLVHYMTEALDAFFAADGLGILVKHVSLLLETVRRLKDDSLASKPHVSYLSSLLRFILKLLTQFGSNDRLRNLIEGTLFKSIKVIFELSTLFGPDVFYFATHILSTFIHTEPTSLSILQESSVPQTLLNALTKSRIPAHADLLAILPQAFDAMCLNSSGASSFIDADPLPNYLRFLSDSTYFRELQQQHNAVSKSMAIGNAVDEFMRHHPNLLSLIIPNLVEAVDLCHQALRREEPQILGEVTCLMVFKIDAGTIGNDIPEVSFEEIQRVEGRRRIDPLCVNMLESLCLFVESIVKTPAHREAFMAQKGAAKLLECCMAPALPADFVTSQACFSINHCFHVLAENDPVPVMNAVADYILSTQESLKWFLSTRRNTSLLLDPLSKASTSEKDWNRIASTLQNINIFGSLIALLADLCFAQHLSFSRSHAKVVPAILEQENVENMLEFIGHVMRCCLWEYWALRRQLPKNWLASACRFSQVPVVKPGKEIEVIPVPAEIRVITGTVDSSRVPYADNRDPRIRNIKATLSILRQVPTSVIAFYSGLARSLAARRSVSTILAELTPEQTRRGFEMLIKSIAIDDFITEHDRFKDVYLENRLISAGISLVNLIFIDESNFKALLNLAAVNIYRSSGAFDKVIKALERVLERVDASNAFDMISVNDALESILGLVSRCTEEPMLKGSFWEDAETEKYLEIPHFFEFISKALVLIFAKLDVSLPLLSIECLQLTLSTCSNALLIRANLQPATNISTFLEEIRRGTPSFTIDRAKFENIPPFEAFMALPAFVKERLIPQIIPKFLEKSKELAFDLAQLICKFVSDKEFFSSIIAYLIDESLWSPSQFALNSKILTIILSSPYRCMAISAAASLICNDFMQHVAEKIRSTDDLADRNLMITSFALISVQLVAFYVAGDYSPGVPDLPIIAPEACQRIFSATLEYLELEELSVDAVHALLHVYFLISRRHELLKAQESAIFEHQHFRTLLKASTKCLDSQDVRNRSTVSLTALILRHFIEAPTYLAALFQQDMSARFRVQNEPSLDIDDMMAFLEPFLLRDYQGAHHAASELFSLDVMAEDVHNAFVANNADGDDGYVPLYTMKSALQKAVAKRQSVLKTSVQRLTHLNEGKEAPELLEAGSFEVSTFPVQTSTELLKLLKDESNSPFAKQVISALIKELLTNAETVMWPSSSDELRTMESDVQIQSAHFYRCVLLLFLSELILAYPVCHGTFLSHPDTLKMIEFVLRVMTPYGNVRYQSMNQAYERSWVQYLLINLCMGSIVEEAVYALPAGKIPMDKLPDGMSDSCRFVVDCLVGELRVLCARNSLKSDEAERELLIGRIFGLSDTIFCLLTIKSATVGRWASSMTAHIASLLLENRVIQLLSSALQFIDSNNPAYEEVTINVVRTLEALCKYSNRLSKLAARRSAAPGASAESLAISDFSVLQDFSSDESGYSDDYGYESGATDDEDEDSIDSDISGMVSDSLDESDSDLDSDDMMDVGSDDLEDDESEGDLSDGSDIEMIAEGDFEGILDGVRGSRNTRITSSGPFELIVEEIDEESDNDEHGDEEDDGWGHDNRHIDSDEGFPVGFDDEDGGDDDGSGLEYDFPPHGHHGAFDSDFDEDEGEGHFDSGSDSGSEESSNLLFGNNEDDGDWMEIVDGAVSRAGGIRGVAGGPTSNLVMEFPGGGSRTNRLRSRHGAFPNEIGAMLNGLMSTSGPGGSRGISYSSQVVRGVDGGAALHPLTARPTLDPMNDPLRAHLPLIQPINAGNGASGGISLIVGSTAVPSTVNAEPFHFPQAVATNRRWQQDTKFAFNDLTRLLLSDLEKEIVAALEEASESPRRTMKELGAAEEGARTRLFDLIHEKGTLSMSASTPVESKNDDDRNEAVNMKDLLSRAISDISRKRDEHEATAAADPSDDVSDTSGLTSPSSGASAVFHDEGMDPDFFGAVPADLYEEVIQQHLNERRNRIPSNCTRIEISPDFLARLPSSIREMYVGMSAEENRAYQVYSARSSRINSALSTPRANGSVVSGSSGSASRDISTLMAELNTFLQAANDSGISEPTKSLVPEFSMKSIALASLQGSPPVDPSSLVAILRSYYSPIISERRLHHKLFQSLCANPRTRVELINLLIFVLERMPSDLAQLGEILDVYVESVTAVAASNSNSHGIGNVKMSGKRFRTSTGGASTPPLLRPQTPLSSAPLLIGATTGKSHVPVLQRTLQLLLHLSAHNDDVCSFFTSPVEKPWTIKRHDRTQRRSAHQTAPPIMTISTKFPLVLLMAGLERSAFTSSSLLMEYLLHLLDTTTAPLSKVVNPQDLKIEIPEFLLSSLVRVLVTCEFTPKAFQYASHVFQHLSSLTTISSGVLGELVDQSKHSVQDVIGSLRKLQEETGEASSTEQMKRFSLSTAPPARLLRLTRVMTSLALQSDRDDRANDRLSSNFTQLLSANPSLANEIADKLGGWREFLAELEVFLHEGLVHAGDSEPMAQEADSEEKADGAASDSERHTVQTAGTAIATVAPSVQTALLLLPVIESYFLLHRFLQVIVKESTLPEPLLKFAEEHREMLNSLIRTKPSLLTQGSLVTLTRIPRVLDFDNKRIFFRQQLHNRRLAGNSAPPPSSVSLNISVRREHVFEDSFAAFAGKPGDEVKWARLSIKFTGEEGVDAGGIAREWFSVLARQMFNPDYALFRTSAADQITYQPNRMSYINPDHLLYFAFVGRIIGKAVFDARLLDCYFTRSFYKHILGTPVEMKDLEAVDPELYKSMCWLVDNDITGVFEDLTFTTDADEFGTVRSVELKPDGANLLVDECNKREYVQLMTEFKLTSAIKPQIDAFLRGFHEIIPPTLISVFNEQELELLISGMPDIDVDDWRANCEYHGGYSVASPQVQWFWRAVRSFDSETRAKLIQFVTGTSKVPLEGFSKLQGSDGVQKFQIHRDPRTTNRLPTAHTCFNQLDLPEYATYEELRQQLLLAINEGEVGFGFI